MLTLHLLLFALLARTPSDAAHHAHPLFSYVSKQTDCGLVEITEAADGAEDQDIDTGLPRLLANLSSCLNDVTTRYSLFAPHFSSKALQSLFDAHLRLDAALGTLQLARPLDREHVCRLSPAPDIDCHCHQARCQLTFKFVAFREARKQHRSSRNHFHQHHQAHRTLVLHMQLADANDNLPTFASSFLYAQVAERIGPQTARLEGGDGEKECGRVARADSFSQTQPDLVALEKAEDLDAQPDTYYTLLLLRNQRWA